MRRRERGWARHHRITDYGILLDFDPSGTMSRNLLEYFQNIFVNQTALLPESLVNRASGVLRRLRSFDVIMTHVYFFYNS